MDEELKLMGKKPGERLNEDVARDVCERAGSAALVRGSISNLGDQYGPEAHMLFHSIRLPLRICQGRHR